MSEKRWKFWGWGHEGSGFEPGEAERLLEFYRQRIGLEDIVRRPPPAVGEVALRAPRLRPPAALESLCTTEPYERLLHSYGKSFPEAVRIFARDFNNAPDLVAKPRSEADVIAILEWASGARAAVIPFGGGSSVVGGVEPDVGKELRRRGQPRSQGAGPGARGRSCEPGRARPGRHARAGARGGAEAATR